MMDDYGDNDFDNLVDHHIDDDVDEYPDHSENIEQDVQDEKRIVPVKIRVKKPQPKLDPERCLIIIIYYYNVSIHLMKTS